MTPSELFDLTGRVAVVTGASRGIGESIARLLAAAGAHVVVVSRKLAGCEAVAESIRAAGGRASAQACHIGELDQIDALWETLRERHGRVDILVNNAAANPYFGPIAATDPGAFQKTVDVNIRGYFFMSARAVTLMATHGGGAIVNVSSVNGLLPGAFQGIYSITKAAVISMTQAFAKEHAKDGIRVNALLPGPTDTKFAATIIHNPDILQMVLQHVPLGRVAMPEELAGAVLYFVSPAGSYTTGACLPVDGGYLIG